MTWKTLRIAVVVGAAMLIVATACGPATPTTGASAAPSAAGTAAATAASGPTRGGTVTIAIWQEPANLAPYYSNQTVQGVVLDNVVEGLLQTQANGDYAPLLAQEVPTVTNGGVKISADGKTMDVTYKLKPGLKWSDGVALTSADIKFTWQVWLSDPKVTTREGYDQITGIDTPDDLTAVMHYKSVYAPYPTRFGSLFSKHSLEKETAQCTGTPLVCDYSKADYVRKPLGTGPFMVTDFKAGESITLDRNPNYRVAGQPYLDKIIFKSVPSSTVAIAQLRAGEVQAMWNILESEAADLEKDPGVKLQVVPGPSVERIEMNTAENKDMTDPSSKHPVLSDKNVRLALIYATPKQQIIDKLLFGKAKVGTSPVSQGWASPKDLTQESFDPKKANDLLDQAGWVKGADGIRSKGGVRASLTITTTTGNATREKVEQVLIDFYQQVGVELKIKNEPSSVLLSGSWSQGDQRKRGSFDLVMYASSPAIDPHQTVAQRYTSQLIPSPANNGNGQNYTRVKNTDIDKAVNDAGATLDFDKRKAAYATALKLLNQEAVIIWLYDRANIDGMKVGLEGWKPNAWQNFVWNSQEWYLKK
jgi:peptide/nickel transport system substrate-binding protein